MKKFEFSAGTPKSDMIMGLCFPRGFMFPTYNLFYSVSLTLFFFTNTPFKSSLRKHHRFCINLII